MGVEEEVICHNLFAQNCCKENIHVGGHSLAVKETCLALEVGKEEKLLI